MNLYLVHFIIFLSLLGFTEYSYQKDTVVTDSLIQENYEPSHTDSELYIDDGFSPGLFFMVLILIGVALILIGIGVALTALILMVLFGLISFGILSTSILIGLNSKSFKKGFRYFVMLTTLVGSVIFWCLTLYFLNIYYNWSSDTIVIAVGILGGIISGLVMGYFICYLVQRLTTYFKAKIEEKKLNLDA